MVNTQRLQSDEPDLESRWIPYYICVILIGKWKMTYANKLDGVADGPMTTHEK